MSIAKNSNNLIYLILSEDKTIQEKRYKDMIINFNNADLTIAVTRKSDNLELVFHHVASIEDRSAKDMAKDGYDAVKGRYVTIRLNAKGDYDIATFKKTNDLIIDILG